MPNQCYMPVLPEGLRKNLMHSVIAERAEVAEDYFVDAKERMLDISHWGRYAAVNSVHFQLTDGAGRPINRRARPGNYIHILEEDVYAVGEKWLAIEAIEYDDYPDENTETFALYARYCARPELHPAPGVHEADCVFTIKRAGKILTSAFCGLHDDQYDSRGASRLAAIATQQGTKITDSQCNALIKGFIL